MNVTLTMAAVVTHAQTQRDHTNAAVMLTTSCHQTNVPANQWQTLVFSLQLQALFSLEDGQVWYFVLL